MRILVVSDTHGNDSAIFSAHEQAGAIDALIHTGDGELDALLFEEVTGCKVLRVAGNCDLGSSAPRELLCTFEGKRLMITHGDRYYVKSGLERLYQHARAEQVQIALFGHTHLTCNEYRDGLLLLNAGTLCRQTTFQSYAVLEINDQVVTAQIYELR